MQIHEGHLTCLLLYYLFVFNLLAMNEKRGKKTDSFIIYLAEMLLIWFGVHNAFEWRSFSMFADRDKR